MTSDIIEKSKWIVAWYYSGFEKNQDPEHPALVRAITEALADARRAALEEAARMVAEVGDPYSPSGLVRQCTNKIVQAIRQRASEAKQ